MSMHKQFMERADWQFYWACQELDKETKQAFMRNFELIKFEAETAKANNWCGSSGRPRFFMMAMVNGMSDEDVRGLIPRVASACGDNKANEVDISEVSWWDWRNLYIKKFAKSVTYRDLTKTFGRFGSVEEICVWDVENGQSGTVLYASAADAEKCWRAMYEEVICQEMMGYELNEGDGPLIVEYAYQQPVADAAPAEAAAVPPAKAAAPQAKAAQPPAPAKAASPQAKAAQPATYLNCKGSDANRKGGGKGKGKTQRQGRKEDRLAAIAVTGMTERQRSILAKPTIECGLDHVREINLGRKTRLHRRTLLDRKSG